MPFKKQFYIKFVVLSTPHPFPSGQLYFGSTEVIVSEEFVMVDLGTLLSNVGGAVGMFLGWSVLDLARAAQEFFKRSCK